MIGWRRADIDDVNRGIIQQVAVIPESDGNIPFAGKCFDMVSARNDGAHFDVEAIDPAIGMHVEIADEATADQPHGYFLHCVISLTKCNRAGSACLICRID